jgi:hypothetical protein
MIVKEFISKIQEFNQESIFKIEIYLDYEKAFINNASLSLGKYCESINKLKYLDEVLYLIPRIEEKDNDTGLPIKELIKGLSYFNEETIINFYNINDYEEQELCNEVSIFYGGMISNRYKYTSFKTGNEYTDDRDILDILQNIDCHISKNIDIDELDEIEIEEILDEFAIKVYQDDIVYLQFRN